MLKIGWAQDPQTLNPFVDYDEEDFRIWAINYDLLVNFDPENLGPAPGIAESWDVSPDKKTVTFHLVKGAKWSDGAADHEQGRQVQPRVARRQRRAVHRLHRQRHVDQHARPDTRSSSRPKKPDARIVGGLFIYILPEHVWGKHSVKDAHDHLQAVDADGRQRPVHRHASSSATGSSGWSATRTSAARSRSSTSSSGSSTATTDAVERALQLGEIDMVTEVAGGDVRPARQEKGIKTVKAPSPSFTELAFNLCSKQNCPDAKFNPAIQDLTVRQAIAYAVDRDRVNEIANRGTSFIGHGILPHYYKAFYAAARADDYPLRPRQGASRCSTPPATSPAATASAQKGDEQAVVQPRRALRVAGQHPGGAAREGDGQADRRSTSRSRSSAWTS